MTIHFAITVGAGRDRPQGRCRVLGEKPSVAALHDALMKQPADKDGWWSAHQWTGDYREEARWESAAALVADVDFHNAEGRHANVPQELHARFEAAMDLLPASLFHRTPRGMRLVLVLDAVVSDGALCKSLNVAYGERVQRVLTFLGLCACKRRVRRGKHKRTIHASGFQFDRGVATDLARFLFRHNAIVGRNARDARLTVCSEVPMAATTVLAWAEQDRAEGEVVR